MQIVILAAGRGIRMGKLTDAIPKPMLQINHKPILAYKLESLPREIEEVILVIGYLGDYIKAYFGAEYDGRKILYIEQRKLDGSGGALTLAKKLLKDEFLVMMGDDLYKQQDILAIMKFDLAMLIMERENPTRFGVIHVDNEDNVFSIIEKEHIMGKAFVNTGLYKLHKNFFKYPLVSIGKGEFGLPQTLLTMNDAFQVKAVKATNWYAIGNPTDLENASMIINEFIS
jgi:NDP-sugar pyrophosphorylase family protein